MCQLLGMNCNVPTDICFSFEGFHQRGGRTDHHADGWGVAFYEGAGCRVLLDSKAAVDSPVADLVRRYPIHSKNVIAHIRKATRGSVLLENTHPFVRELWGRYWTFAHNGTLETFVPGGFDVYRPVGSTDSEAAFCHILQALRGRFPAGEPALDDLYRAVAELAGQLNRHGKFNFLMSNGECLFAHCSDRLSYILRHPPFTTAHLIDQDVTVDFRLLTGLNDKVAVIATLPLTDDEVWTTISPGDLLVFRDGAPVWHGGAHQRLV